MKKNLIKIVGVGILVMIGLILIPQTRQPIKKIASKGYRFFVPRVEYEKATFVSDYKWSLKDENGQDFEFANTKGKVVFLNLWATWCGYCVAELPEMEKLYKSYGDEVVFLFVSDEKQSKTARFKKKHGYVLPFFASETESPMAFKTASLPRTFIIDKQGNIVLNKGTSKSWDNENIRSLLDGLIAAE